MEGLISADEPHLRFERLFEKSCFRSWPGHWCRTFDRIWKYQAQRPTRPSDQRSWTGADPLRWSLEEPRAFFGSHRFQEAL